MEIKTLAKNTAILASPKIFIFIIGILKSKLIASFLGATGFGVIDQLTSTINYIRRSTLSFMPDGMVKLIAKERANDNNKEVLANIIKTFFLMVIPLAICIFALAWIFADDITIFVLGDIEYKRYYLIALIALPISFLSVSFGALLKAFKEIKSIALSDIIKAIINVIIFIPLIYFYGIEGGVLHVTLSFITTLVIIFLIVRKSIFKKYNISFADISKAVFSNIYFKELLTFISVGMIAGTFRVFENMASRAIVVNNLGIDKIGIYAPVTKWQALFIGFILPSVYTYLYPRLSESKTNREVSNVINDVIRMITFLTLPFVIVGISTREWIIPLFYSKDFIEASLYLPYHFSFLLTAVWGTIFEQIFAPTGRLKSFLIFMIVLYSISLIMVYYFVPIIGLYGYLLKFTITPLMILIVFFFYWRKKIQFKLKIENLYIILYSVFTCGILLLIKDLNIFFQASVGIFLILIMVFFLKKNERKFLLKKVGL